MIPVDSLKIVGTVQTLPRNTRDKIQRCTLASRASRVKSTSFPLLSCYAGCQKTSCRMFSGSVLLVFQGVETDLMEEEWVVHPSGDSGVQQKQSSGLWSKCLTLFEN